MALTFADTHNMIAFLTKSDASEGFEQIIDFLNTSVIQYALMVNPTIYVSCIKQFWPSVSLKKTNDVVRLQALIDRRKVIITEDTVRQALRLNDADSIDCLPNEEIFVELARMGYDKPSTKLTFYKAFFSAQWKFLIHTILQSLIGDLSSHTTKYTSSALTQKVFANMRMVGKGFSGVETPLFDGMLVPQQVHDDVADDVDDDVADDVDDDVADDIVDADAEPTPPSPTPATTAPPQQALIPLSSQVQSTPPPSPHQSLIAQPSSPPPQQPPSHDAEISMALLNQLLATCAILTKKVGDLEHDKIAQAIEITKLKQRAKRLEKKREDASKQRGKIAELDTDEDVTLKEVDAEKNDEVQGRLPESQAQVCHLDLEHAQKVLSKCSKKKKGVIIQDPKEVATASLNVQSEVKSKDNGKGILVEKPKPLKRQAQIEQDEAFARELEAELNANINWNEVIEQVKRKEKQDNAVMRYQALKRKPVTKARARKNMWYISKIWLGSRWTSSKDIEEEEIKLSKRKSENLEQQAAKKQKINEEVEELKTHLQIVPNDEDDVYTEATPLALKVSVVDCQIHTEHNKPYYKIIRADGSHQLFLSFISMLRNFDREDLEML
nr:hypothetical protein [Tanacetum cinerariifolium]